jgi:hypothetical protein
MLVASASTGFTSTSSVRCELLAPAKSAELTVLADRQSMQHDATWTYTSVEIIG